MKNTIRKKIAFILAICFICLLFACQSDTTEETSVDRQNADEWIEEKQFEKEDSSGEEKDSPFYSHYFRNIMEQKPELKEVPISQLCMLGSHDTFTDKIDMKSKIDIANENMFSTNTDLISIAKGIYVNYAKAQTDDVYCQLSHGVRYLDMRVSEINGEMYNCHTLVSDTLSNSLLLVLQFLDENPGEFIIVNVHKYYADDYDFSKLETAMRKTVYNGKNIFDYIHYGREIETFSGLTYNKVTENGTQAGVVLFSNSTANKQGFHPVFSQLSDYFYMPSSKNSIIESDKKLEEILQKILIAQTRSSDYYCMCQAQTTPTKENILATLTSVSLLEKAKEHNDYILHSEHFDEILDAFPIMEFDYVTYNETGFLDEILQRMTEKTLSK